MRTGTLMSFAITIAGIVLLIGVAVSGAQGLPPEYKLPATGDFSASGTLTREDAKTGRTYKVEFFGNVIPGPDRTLSKSLFQARGEYPVASKDVLATTGEVTDVSQKRLQLTVGDAIKDFVIERFTKICRDRQRITLDTIKSKSMATVTTKRDSNVALSVRSGPMLFRGVTEKTLVAYDCETSS
jgi:hypothetical protein